MVGQSPSRRPTKREVTSAHNLFEWVERYAHSHPEQGLDQSELDELWTAADTALGVIDLGEVGSRRSRDLLQVVDQARGRGATLDFGTAARYAGPILARLAAELENWPGGQAYRRHSKTTVNLPIRLREDRGRRGSEFP